MNWSGAFCLSYRGSRSICGRPTRSYHGTWTIDGWNGYVRSAQPIGWRCHIDFLFIPHLERNPIYSMASKNSRRKLLRVFRLRSLVVEKYISNLDSQLWLLGSIVRLVARRWIQHYESPPKWIGRHFVEPFGRQDRRQGFLLHVHLVTNRGLADFFLVGNLPMVVCRVSGKSRRCHRSAATSACPSFPV